MLGNRTIGSSPLNVDVHIGRDAAGDFMHALSAAAVPPEDVICTFQPCSRQTAMISLPESVAMRTSASNCEARTASYTTPISGFACDLSQHLCRAGA